MTTDATPPESDRAVVPFTLSGWDDRLRGFHCGAEVDVFALVTERYLIFIDTSATPEQAAAVAEAMRAELAGRQPLVILTHADFDHAWGNAAFAPDGALPTTIIGHTLTRERLRSADAAAELARRLSEDARFGSVRLIAPDIAYTERLEIDGGDLTLELLHTPGHTPDHTVVWIPALRLLIAGDAVERPWPYIRSAADLPILRATLARLAALEPASIAVCHGRTSDPALIASDIAYFDLLERRCREALARTPALAKQAADLPGADLETATIPYAEALRAVSAASGAAAEGWSYEAFHHAALRATLGWLASEG